MFPRGCVGVLFVTVLLVGCSAGWYEHQADRQVYGIVADREREVLGEARGLSIVPPPPAVQELEALKEPAGKEELQQAMERSTPESEVLPSPPGRPDEVPPEEPVTPGGLGPPRGDESSISVDPVRVSGAESAPASPGAPMREAAGASGQGLELLESGAGERDKFSELERLGQPIPIPEGARVLGLKDALLLAFRHSRDYLSQEETLYLQAMALTLEQYLFTPRFRAALGGALTRTGSDEERRTDWDAQGLLGVTWQLPDGGDLAATMTTSAGGDFDDVFETTSGSSWSLSLRQPLLRGFGRSIAQEPLVQAERNVIYAVRQFERFRREFVVDTISGYYRTLQEADVVRNQWNNYQLLIRNLERDAALAKAGWKPEFQVDQSRQAAFNARNSWVRAVEAYELAVDRFKIDLGLPTEVPIVLDARELEKLRSTSSLEPPALSLEEATEIALEARLDLMVDRDRVYDAQRRVNVARNGLLGDLDLGLSAAVDSRGDGQPGTAQFHEGDYRVSLDYELPVDRLSQRNQYRQAQIALQRQLRSTTEAEDRVKLAVRQAYRAVQQAIESYKIQHDSLKLADQRVESVSMLRDFGRVETRDLLEALDDQVQAQNRLTNAMVSLFLARLQLTLDAGLMQVDEQGNWVAVEAAPRADLEMDHE